MCAWFLLVGVVIIGWLFDSLSLSIDDENAQWALSRKFKNLKFQQKVNSRAWKEVYGENPLGIESKIDLLYILICHIR